MITDPQLKQNIREQYKKDLANGIIRMETKPTGNFITNGIDSIICSDPDTTMESYYNTFMNSSKQTNTIGNSNLILNTLNRVTIYVGSPDTGKTYKAQEFCQINNIDYIIMPCHDGLTLETFLEDFTLVNGQPTYQPSLALQMISDKNDKDCVIILDELNTCRTAVLKTFQPIFDTTSKSFVYRGVTYHKNMNCKFICTMNDKDKGISVLPDAVISRACFKYFMPVDDATISRWTGYKLQFVHACREVYQLLGIESLFGTRQVNAMHNLNVIECVDHMKGLLATKGLEFESLDTVEYQNKIQIAMNSK